MTNGNDIVEFEEACREMLTELWLEKHELHPCNLDNLEFIHVFINNNPKYWEFVNQVYLDTEAR